VNNNNVVIELRRRVAELEAAEARHKQVEKELIRNLEERLMTEETLRQRNRELALIHHAGPAFSSTLDLDRVLVSVLAARCGWSTLRQVSFSANKRLVLKARPCVAGVWHPARGLPVG
jgi:hypothetical protein